MTTPTWTNAESSNLRAVITFFWVFVDVIRTHFLSGGDEGPRASLVILLQELQELGS